MHRLWYVAYGSNLSLARFRCYLLGGRPEGGSRTNPGCRDRSEPTAVTGLAIPGVLCFAGHSSVWGGGMAIYDAEGPGRVAARAYLLTRGQFIDVLAQETRQAPGMELDLSPLERTGRQSFGPGRYQTLLSMGTREDLPMVTFTSGIHRDLNPTAPSEAYLRVLAVGLRESHQWSARRIGAYLAAIPGADPAWTPDEIETLAA